LPTQVLRDEITYRKTFSGIGEWYRPFAGGIEDLEGYVRQECRHGNGKVYGKALGQDHARRLTSNKYIPVVTWRDESVI
jgi:hypothetical protein